MPNISVSTPTGDLSMHYNIVTPTSEGESALEIVPEIPTIVFFHSLYVAQEIFQPQASDPLLRKFNLVFIDLRSHGKTQGRVGSPYTPTQTADDVYRVMTLLKLPPCHLFGLSIGSSAALELAIEHPECVLSLTLSSPLPKCEPEMALSGREEIWYCWSESLKGGPDDMNTEMIDETIYGVLQMIFNNSSSPDINAVKDVTMEYIFDKWAFAPEKMEDGFGCISKWFAMRKVMEKEDLSKIRCPVLLIHCRDDLPYPTNFALETEAAFKDANVDVELEIVDGPHFGSFTNPKPVNKLLHDMVVSHSSNPGAQLPPTATEPMMTPWHAVLEKRGYYRSGGDSSDEMEFF